MSYRGSRVRSVDSFDGYDTTPYSGGFDLSLTYGRPLQPSDEICYPVSASGDVDLDRAHYSSGSQTSVFKTGNAQKSDCYGLLRPGFQLQPQPVSNTGYPGYGHQSYGHGGGGASDYGSGYGGRPQFQDYGSTYGQGYHHPQHQQFRSEYGSGYESGRKPQYGYEYGREGSKHHGDEGYGASGYGRRENNDYVYGGNTSYVRPSHGVGEEESAKFRSYGEKGSGGHKNSSYSDEYQSTGYRKPSYYGGEQGEGYGPSKYEWAAAASFGWSFGRGLGGCAGIWAGFGRRLEVMILMMWKRSISIISIIFATTRVFEANNYRSWSLQLQRLYLAVAEGFRELTSNHN